MEKKIKYPVALISDLSCVFASRDSNVPGYLSGPKLTELFKGLGFPDKYVFPGIGIVTPDAESLSRTQYVQKRLTDINDAYRLPEALHALLKITGSVSEVTNKLTQIFDRHNISNPVIHSVQTSIEPVTNSVPAVRPYIGEMKDEILETSSPMTTVEIERDVDSVADSSGIYDAVFSEIPSGAKVAFISYSWDDENHKNWVLNLSKDLLAKGIYTLLDQYLPIGYSLTYFMNKGIDIADKVIIIGTPQYKEKSIKSISGGVTYEGSIIYTELMHNIVSTKFVPILRSGEFKTSLPSQISARRGLDFRNDTNYNSVLNELVREIYNVPAISRPTLGQVPTFGYEDLTDREKADLRSPESDFRKCQDRKWLNRLLGSFSFELLDNYINNNPLFVDERVFISIDMWDAIISNSTFRIYDPYLLDLITEFHSIWHEAEIIGQNFYSIEAGTNKVKFHGLQQGVFVSEDAECAYKKLCDLLKQMQPLLRKLARYIQDKFEIDVEATSQAFIKSISR